MNFDLPIRSERLEMRRFSRNDLEAFQAYRCDSELSKYQGWEPTPDALALAFLELQSHQTLESDGQWLQIAVTCARTSRLMGDLGIRIADSGSETANMGFTIAQPFQRKGYATEAANAILTCLFTRTMIQLVEAVTDARNTASIVLLSRLGFTRTRTDTALFRGEPCTEHTFSLQKMMHRSHKTLSNEKEVPPC